MEPEGLLDRLHKQSLEDDQDKLRCVLDASDTLVYASPAFAALAGRNLEDIIGTKAEDVLTILDEDADGHHTVVLRRTDSTPPSQISGLLNTVVTPDGHSYRILSLDLTETENQRAQTLKKLSDHIFAQKETISRISDHDGELRHFINLSSDLFGVFTREGRFLRVNTAFNKTLARTDKELKDIPFLDLICPEDRSLAEKQMQKVMRAPADVDIRVDFSARVIRKDGALRKINWIQKSHGDEIYIVGHDITDIGAYEEDLRRQEKQLQEAEEIAKMGHWRWEVGSDVIEWSDQIYKIFGVRPETFTPTLDNVNACLLKRDLGRLYRAFDRAIREKRNYEIDFRLRHPSGQVRFIRCEGRCVIDPETGNVTDLYGIMQDMTERTLHERALKEAKDAAEQAYAAKTRFLANMSHELRTPLNAIIGFSEMMQRQLLGPVGNDRYLEYINGIRESGVHLLDLINDILDMSKIEAGKYELDLETINIGKLIRLTVHMMEGRAHEGEVRLIIPEDFPEDLQMVGDRRGITQILLNLLSNAIKFTDPGGTVTLECGDTPGGIVIRVIDTGIGIPASKIKHVTRPFEQVDSALTRKREGSGLGLTITKELIELHNGTLDIQSLPGKGTTVTVYLPSTILPEKKNPELESGSL